MITITSLRHPAMIQRLNLALKLSSSSLGHLMGGHGKRVYVQNRHGYNIMRIDYHAVGQFTVYGEESRDITHMVRKALGMPPVKLDLNRNAVKAEPKTIIRPETLHKEYAKANVYAHSLGGGVTQYVVRDLGGNQIGCYSYASSAELKAFMHSRGN